MILYKYVDAKTADLIIKNSTLKFSNPSSLNDPFELTGLYYSSEPEGMAKTMKFIAATMSYGILSLTRNPLNPLMWAHYGKGEYLPEVRGRALDFGNGSHAGFVFGIDVDSAGLNENRLNVIPAKFGSVIYTSTKPKYPFENSQNHYFFEGLEHSFNPNILEALQRAFLYKPAYWSYEEEVRVIRNVRTRNNEIQEIDKSSIRELYLGFRNSYKKDYLNKIKNELNVALPHCKIYVCGFNASDWTFNKVSIDEAISHCLG